MEHERGGVFLKARKRGQKKDSKDKLKVLIVLLTLIIVSAYGIALVFACGPHIETPRSVVINEIHVSGQSWIELVNPTDEDKPIYNWMIQIKDNNEWKTIHRIQIDMINKWGSGDEYRVFELSENPSGQDVIIRLVDEQGNEVDSTHYSAVAIDHSWARYKQTSGLPVDTDTLEDWYVSSNATKGFENDYSVS
jgi:hypothetical protein